VQDSLIPDRIDWRTVRLLTIDLNTIRLLTDGGERTFDFESEEQLNEVLRVWVERADETSSNAELLARLKR